MAGSRYGGREDGGRSSIDSFDAAMQNRRRLCCCRLPSRRHPGFGAGQLMPAESRIVAQSIVRVDDGRREFPVRSIFVLNVDGPTSTLRASSTADRRGRMPVGLFVGDSGGTGGNRRGFSAIRAGWQSFADPRWRPRLGQSVNVVIVVVDCRQSFHSSTGKEEL